ncbi:MAG: hypothetical protein RLZZ176_2083 [Cyanobacteriota bacterium]
MTGLVTNPIGLGVLGVAGTGAMIYGGLRLGYQLIYEYHQEAREWWKSNCGKPLYVDISQLNLDPLNTYDFNGSTPKRYNFFLTPFSDSRTARVHGTLTMRLKNSSTGEVGFFRDQNGYFDTYDFNSDGRLTRDATTWFARTFVVGNGTGFGFIPYGKNPRVLVAAPLILQGP